LSAPPPDMSRLFEAASNIGLFIFGCAIPLVGSAMVPNGWQRPGAAVFALISVGVFLGFGADPATPIGAGIATGFVLASAKLLTGIRFL
jgi:hypothetical protein